MMAKGLSKNAVFIIIGLAAAVLILLYLLFYQQRIHNIEKKQLEQKQQPI